MPACGGLQVTKIDAKGLFSFHPRSFSGPPDIKVFKSGLEVRHIHFGVDWDIRTAAFAGSIEERQRQYNQIGFLLQCGRHPEAVSQLRPMGEEIDRDYARLRTGQPPYFVRHLDELARMKE